MARKLQSLSIAYNRNVRRLVDDTGCEVGFIERTCEPETNERFEGSYQYQFCIMGVYKSCDSWADGLAGAQDFINNTEEKLIDDDEKDLTDPNG